jgi:hypothetical protein
MEWNDLSPLEPKEHHDPIKGLLRDRARRSRPANERSPSPTFDEFEPQVPRAHEWYTMKRSENERYKKSWEGMDDLLKEAEDSVRAAQQFLRPDQRRAPEVLLEDADPRLSSLEETDMWIEEAQKKLDEQQRAACRPLPMRQATTRCGTMHHGPPSAHQESTLMLDDLQQSTCSGRPQRSDRSPVSTSGIGGALVGPDVHSADVGSRKISSPDAGRPFEFWPIFRIAAPLERRY